MELNFTPVDKQQEITYLAGKVADPVIPVQLKIDGRIDAPRLYLSKKIEQVGIGGEGNCPADNEYFQLPSKKETIIIVDEDAGTIILNLSPNNPRTTIIAGALELNEDLKAFGINDNKMYTRESLVKFLRFNKRHFRDADVYQNLLESLQKLSLKANVQIEASSDNRGNKQGLFDKKLDTEKIPALFALKMPVYKGFPPLEFMVEVCINQTEGSVAFWFESPACAELIDTVKLEILDSEVKEFKDDFVVIYK